MVTMLVDAPGGRGVQKPWRFQWRILLRQLSIRLKNRTEFQGGDMPSSGHPSPGPVMPRYAR